MRIWDMDSSGKDEEYEDFDYAFRLHTMFVVPKLNKSKFSFEYYNDLRCRYGGYPSYNRMKKICVSPRGVYSFSDNSYGIKWVGLHGMEDSTCIVARHSDLDLKRVGPGLRQVTDNLIMHYIAASLRTELEGISKANSSADKLHGGPGLAMKKPFGVVSVNPSTDMVCEHCGYYEAEGAECDAIHFLRKTMLTNPLTTMHDTIQTAIYAFQTLCNEELKAEDICVSVCPENLGTITTSLTTDEIKEHLAQIQGRFETKLKKHHHSETKLEKHHHSETKLKKHHHSAEILTRTPLKVKISNLLDLRHVEQLAQEFPDC